jgi:translation initiation factor IF-3
MNKNKRKHLINGEIRFPQVRVTDEGIMSIQEANQLAISKDMDLVLINDKADIPICRILNYEKFIYEQNKKGKPKTLDIKEIKLSYNISQNDIDYRLKNTIEFLTKGHRIKISMRFKGREMTYVDKGMAVMLNFILNLSDNGVGEAMPKLEGKQIIGYVKPISKK